MCCSCKQENVTGGSNILIETTTDVNKENNKGAIKKWTIQRNWQHRTHKTKGCSEDVLFM
jgi:hypothetical protein